MNNLRPPKLHQIQRTDDSDTPEAPPTQAAHQSYVPLLLVAAGVIALASILLFAIRRPAEHAVVSPTAMPVATVMVRETVVVTPIPTATPDCVSGRTQLAVIESLEKQGDWSSASRQAEAALAIEHLCQPDVAPLTAQAVLSGLNVLYAKQFEPLDRAGQQQEVDDFARLRERARLAGVDLPTPLQVAQASFRISQFRLTVAAIEIAHEEGTFNPLIDRATTKLYISALYGLGYWYTKADPSDALYAEGLGYLSASHQLAVEYKTGQGEAAALLTTLRGSDAASWPVPYRSPLLTAHL